MSKGNFGQRCYAALSGWVARWAMDREDAALGPAIDDDGFAHASKDWQPGTGRTRVEIMVTGDPSRVGAVADIMDEVQKNSFAAATPQSLEMRITGFLDGCVHRSKWFRQPFKAAAQARHWHCQQSKTRFTDALADSAGEMVDAVVIIGHRFDDDIGAALRQAETLKAQGVKIHCFHTGSDAASRDAYEQLTAATEGVFMPLADQRALAEVMPVIMAHIGDAGALLRLEPQTESAQKLKSLLLRQDAQAEFPHPDQRRDPLPDEAT